MANLARRYMEARDVLFLGRGLSFPIALEGALKLKEISYVHAEGYAAGEMKHGPIALIDSHVPVLVLVPRDDNYERSLSNLQEAKASIGISTPTARFGPRAPAQSTASPRWTRAGRGLTGKTANGSTSSTTWTSAAPATVTSACTAVTT